MPHGRIILMTPGPTITDHEILLEIAKPTMSHTSPEFDKIHSEVISGLREVFGTSGEVIVIPGSGTSAMELALRSAVKPGDKVLILRAGFFGDYLASGVEYIGGKPEKYSSSIGKGFTPGDLDRLLEKNKDADAVAFQHVETSTSVANPVKELSRVAKEWGLKVIVDGVASIGGMEMKQDEWGVDVCFTGSQKALGVPPGLGIVAFSKDYSRELETRTNTLYFNIKMLLKEMESTRNYYLTPSVNLIYGLKKSLEIIKNEGLENRFLRHKIMAEAVRNAISYMGLKLVADEEFRADTVTAVYLPENIEWPKLYNGMRSKGIELAGGLGELKGKIFRIGHMGQTSINEIVATIAALERTLLELGYKVRLGQALSKMQETLYNYKI